MDGQQNPVGNGSTFDLDDQLLEANIDHNLSRIEVTEQDLIQHVRTSGIRKPRETFLIDEIMNIRRERRKFCTQLTSHVHLLQHRNEALINDLKEVKEQVRSERSNNSSLLSNFESIRNNELKTLETRYETENTQLLEKIQQQHRSDVDRLKAKYESKMKLIESRFSEVLEAKQRSDGADIEIKAREIAAKVKLELEAKLNKKIQT